MNDDRRIDRRRVLLAGAATAWAAPAIVRHPLATTAAASHVAQAIGNDSIVRTNRDSFSNFVYVDGNNPATASTGTIQRLEYYAYADHSFAVMIVNSSNVVQYTTGSLTESSDGVYSHTISGGYTPSAGDKMAVWFGDESPNERAVPWDGGGAAGFYSNINSYSSPPTVGTTLSGTPHNRTYSVGAYTT